MPTKLKTRCRHVGCPELTDNKTGYCDRHKAQTGYRLQRRDKEEQQFYSSRRWREVSIAKRQRDPFCERCQREGKITPAVLVHHKVPIKDGGDPWDWNNFESLCASCQAIEHRGRPAG